MTKIVKLGKTLTSKAKYSYFLDKLKVIWAVFEEVNLKIF